MEKKTVVALGIGVVAVGGLYLYMKSQKDKSDSDANLRVAQAEAEAEAEAVIVAQQEVLPPPAPAYVPPLRRIEVANSKRNTWVGIPSRSRGSASALEIGDQGMINNEIPCTVSDFWIDSNGKKGAFKCDGQDWYEIPGGSRFEW